MGLSIFKMQANLMKNYYKNFSKYAKGQKPDCKVAWVTAFTPVEILEALGILYYYPESYAAVIAASEQEQAFIEKSEKNCLSKDCCSYSCCYNGCLELEGGPRGIPPIPDVLIATNNQCNTLPGWWNTLAQKYNIPLIILDYPGDYCNPQNAYEYVYNQHKEFIKKMEKLSGKTLDIEQLNYFISNSQKSVTAWRNVISFLGIKKINITTLFDSISFLITARCQPETSEMYNLMAQEMEKEPDLDENNIPLFWLGYPLWYHKDRYLSELLNDCNIVGTNYITWWNLNYQGNDAYEKLFNAYNYTFLNLSQLNKDKKLKDLIKKSGAKGAIVLHNKSCKCDFVSARNIDLPQAELDIDMIDRNYLALDKAKNQIQLLKDSLCTKLE